MSPETSQVRSRYLALALDARKVIDALIVFVDTGERKPDLARSLKEALVSLKAVKEKKEIFSPQRNKLAFSEYYEQVRTVHEAFPTTEREQIVGKLQKVIKGSAKVDEQQRDAFDIIKFLSAIESRALYYYRPQP
ncbi:MAG TPA: hypothetical protein VMU45_07280 [Candidatus Eisenbacteria bacterium]|nr:hypothetical protein [Candidatus Eisenbacteria bacterium]